MYVHIGKDIVIDSNEIITILNLEKMLYNKKLENILKELKIENNIINISNENNKSLLITKKDEKIKIYISNISSTTLLKRIQKEIL